MNAIVVTERVVVPKTALTIHAVRSGGPGGQNVNKVSTKVELRVDLAAILGLSDAQRARLLARVRGSLDEAGRLIVVSQRTRSQVQNLEDAREKVRELVASALVAPRRRIATKPTRSSKARRLDTKHRDSEKKRQRRWSGD